MSTTEFAMVFPLPNLQMEKDEVRLEKEIRIRRLQPQEVDFLQESKVCKIRIKTLKVRYENVLEIRSSAPFPTGAIDIILKQRNVLETLRLFKEGHIFIDFSIPSAPITLRGDVRDVFDTYFISMSTFQPELYMMEKQNYVLESGETKKLTDLHKIMKKVKLQSDLKVAVSWFGQALETADSLDSLIKHIVSLEAMYLKGQGELTYRLSHLVSSLLGKTANEKVCIKHMVKEFYKMRNKIIHGGKRSYIIPHEYLSILERYSRTSIVKMVALRQKYKRDKLLELIEHSVFDDRQRARLEKEINAFYGFTLY